MSLIYENMWYDIAKSSFCRLQIINRVMNAPPPQVFQFDPLLRQGWLGQSGSIYVTAPQPEWSLHTAFLPLAMASSEICYEQKSNLVTLI